MDKVYVRLNNGIKIEVDVQPTENGPVAIQEANTKIKDIGLTLPSEYEMFVIV